MYRHNEKQLQFEKFKLPFGGKLRNDNRWVKLAKQIPWEEIEDSMLHLFPEPDKEPPPYLFVSPLEP